MNTASGLNRYWLSSLIKGLSSVPSTHMAAHNHLQLQFQEIWYPILNSIGTSLACGAHKYTREGKTFIYAANKQIYILKRKLLPQNYGLGC